MVETSEFIPALVPRDETGAQFVCYGDACSGVPGAPHERTFAAVNSVVARIRPVPEFICFPGDEIRGLTANADALRKQWDYWFSREMAWLDRQAIPLYHTTANHTTYDVTSESVFREVLSHLPQNGPAEQKGLAYFVRREHLLMVFVNTLFSGLGGEGRVETEWLDRTLAEHADAKYKIVFGHHPVFSVNGFSGSYQRDLAPENGQAFWRCLAEHRVLAYFCSHILAFDVQVHEGILQILTAGAGTAHRMPEGIEYLHCVQVAIDADGLRYQVLDTEGQVREALNWPLNFPASALWKIFAPEHDAPTGNNGGVSSQTAGKIAVWKFIGETMRGDNGTPQTLLCGWRQEHADALPPLWIGLQGAEQRLCVLLSQAPERSPHLWLGPEFPPGTEFEFQLAVHAGMGPGGILWRWNDNSSWSSLTAASPWGAEKLAWPDSWSLGHGPRGTDDQPFRGQNLRAQWHCQELSQSS